MDKYYKIVVDIIDKMDWFRYYKKIVIDIIDRYI